MTVKKVGLIVNPIAGIGGRVGLKGSDGFEIREKAFALGAKPISQERARQMLEKLIPMIGEIELVTYPGEMGGVVALESGFAPTIIGSIEPDRTTADDTRQAARSMFKMNVDLLLFVGGDGTAQDIYNAIGDRLAVIGVPAGVKIHSGVYAKNPAGAGELAVSYLRGRSLHLRNVEVMDLDESAYREGILSASLCGYLKIPYRRRLLQGLKDGSSPSEKATHTAIATDIIERMVTEIVYVVGPGTTTRAIISQLGLNNTLLGVDVLLNNEILAGDVNEEQLLKLLLGNKAKIIVTPIGGQGYLFGRGNQQISPRVIRSVGVENILVVSTVDKLNSLKGRPLLVDTGDQDLDKSLSRYVKVITGYNDRVIYKVST